MEPDNSSFYNFRGLAYINLSQLDQAFIDINKAIDLNPDKSDFYYSRGIAYFNSGQLEFSKHDFEKVISSNKTKDFVNDAKKKLGIIDDLLRYSITLERSKKLLNSDDKDNAIQVINELTEIIKEEPDYPPFYYFRGLAYKKSCQKELAKQDLYKFISLKPEEEMIKNAEELLIDIELENQYGSIEEMSEENKYEAAIKLIDIELKSNPDNIEKYCKKGNFLYKLKKFTDAINIFNKVIELDPNNDYAYSSKGLCLFNLKNYNESILCFENAIKLNPQDEISYLYIGICLMELQKYKEAVEYFDKTIEIDPELEIAIKYKELCLNIIENKDN